MKFQTLTRQDLTLSCFGQESRGTGSISKLDIEIKIVCTYIGYNKLIQIVFNHV